MKMIIITGATSFIGRKLIDKLILGDFKIYAIVRDNSDKISIIPKSSKITIIRLDMHEYENLDKFISECDCFIHLAWNGTRGNDRMNEKLQKRNYNYSAAAIKSVIKLGCKKIITAGSQAEYGIHDGIISEDTECHPETEYGKYKLKFYMDSRNICDDNDVQLIEPRFFSLYGPDDNPKTMINTIITKMLNNQDCPLTKCIQMWDFLHIDDAVEALIKMIMGDCRGGIYNFGSGIAKPLRDFVDEMYYITQSRSKLLYGAIPYPVTGMVSIIPDVARIKRELNWTPKISFTDGIKEIVRYEKKDLSNEKN